MSKTKIPCSELPWGQLPSPTVQASAVTSPFCCALQKCVLGWVRAGLPGSSITAFGSHQKCLLPGPHISFHILRGISFWFACFSLILFFSFFLFFFSEPDNCWRYEFGRGLRRSLSAVSSSKWSFTSRSGRSRSYLRETPQQPCPSLPGPDQPTGKNF